ncbi:unnamed protein product [Dibothriocephalus latus]|uniref:VWFA domain-containing protein n=1 Tax=Dibothriocephalus latus TaxID=60516 RepID=A0A3P7LRT0_DIBLA|nr:unnamed protein product [Dibothriocephalus latus]
MFRRNCDGAGLFDTNGIALKDVPLKEISVHAEVHNLVANVTCKLVYKNDSKDLVETRFVFPIDADAAIYHFEAEIGKTRIVAKCRERLEMTLQSDFKFDHDLEIEIVFSDPTKLMVTYEEGDSKVGSGILALDCLTVNFLPMFKEDTDARNEVVFLIDRSGSMNGKNILQAKESLLLFLKSLPTDCRFQIVGFGSTFSALFNEPRDYTEESMETALEYQKNLTANMGGTEVLGALESIYAKEITGSGWHRKIIFLTDGDITNQPQVISLVRRNVKTTRLFAIGLGDGASTSLITGVARAGGGKSAFVRNKERLQPVVLQILQLALQSLATDVELTWSITGDAKGDAIPAEVSRQEEFGEPSLPFHRQAAKVQILELADKHASLVETLKDKEQEKTEVARVQKQIVALSTSANVISKFTAFVGVDPEKLGEFRFL